MAQKGGERKVAIRIKPTALCRFPPFAAWRAIGKAGPISVARRSRGRSRGGSIPRESTERDGFDRGRGLNPYLSTVYGEPYPGA
jgi:hypothetical protein